MSGKRLRKPSTMYSGFVHPDVAYEASKVSEREKNRKERLAAMSVDRRLKEEKKQERRQKREELGFDVSKNRKNKDGPMIPWIPFKKDGRTIVLSTGIQTMGHGDKSYTSKWIAPDKKVPGVVVSRNNANTEPLGVPYAVYTADVSRVNSNAQPPKNQTDRYITKRPLYKTNETGMMNRTTQKLVKTTLAGPSVDEITSLLYELTPDGVIKERENMDFEDRKDLYSLKLLGDKFTAIEAERLNKPGNYIVKPYSASFAEYIQGFVWASGIKERNDLSNLMIKERRYFLPFYFENGVVYTGDRPLFLFCVKKGIPCIIERPATERRSLGFVFTGLDGAIIKNQFETWLRGRIIPTRRTKYNTILECLEDPTDRKISIFDCFHDFGKTDKRSFITADILGDDLKKIYKAYTDIDLGVFIDTSFTSKTDITNTEKVITEFLDSLSLSTYDEESLTRLFDGGVLGDYCIMYDAGTAIPISVYERIAATTQRVTNGFYGAPAVRKLKNFKGRKPELERYNLPNLNFTELVP